MMLASLKIPGAADVGVIDRRPVRGPQRLAGTESVLMCGGEGESGLGLDKMDVWIVRR